MEIINQTNRTLLLDVINPQMPDLLTMIGDVKGIDSLDDDKMKEINHVNIINRRGDGICPVEERCTKCDTIEECLQEIDDFVKSIM